MEKKMIATMITTKKNPMLHTPLPVQIFIKAAVHNHQIIRNYSKKAISIYEEHVAADHRAAEMTDPSLDAAPFA